MLWNAMQLDVWTARPRCGIGRALDDGSSVVGAILSPARIRLGGLGALLLLPAWLLYCFNEFTMSRMP